MQEGFGGVCKMFFFCKKRVKDYLHLQYFRSNKVSTNNANDVALKIFEDLRKKVFVLVYQC